jgi:hypothetical protein
LDEGLRAARSYPLPPPHSLNAAFTGGAR